MDFVCDCLSVNSAGRLAIGGADAVELAKEYGTPVFLMDEDDIRKNCREYITSMRETYEGEFSIAYASKALSFTYLYSVMAEEGMCADVVSGGEICAALRGGLSGDKLYFHGNNKTDPELLYALDKGVRCFVVDNREELLRLDRFARHKGIVQDVSFRMTPGIDAHTHEFIKTGKVDSKFGLTMENGDAYEVIREASGLESVRVTGIHCHIGSQIFEVEPFTLSVRVMMGFMKKVRDELGVEMTSLNLGGGFGIRYIPSHDPRSVRSVVEATARAVTDTASELGLPLPHLILEPGRSIVGPSGITVYKIGNVKDIPGVRTYISVDGGMTDNPRFALYGAAYDALLPERPLAERTELVTIAGRCCESGDLLARDIYLPPAKSGDYLAVLATGAYNYSMASNYNRIPRPPIVMVSGGRPKLVVRRENYEDMLKCDV